MFNIFPLLGGHASDTKRATNLKTFIRQDESKALIRIHLYNGGYLAYQPEEWGKEIIFERTISDTGSQTFTIKGKIRSNTIGFSLIRYSVDSFICTSPPLADLASLPLIYISTVLSQFSPINFLKSLQPFITLDFLS